MSYKEAVLLSQKDLNISNRSLNAIVVKAKRGPSKNTKIPLILNEELAFLSACIIGDGHLKKDKLQITFECTNKNIVIYLRELCKKLFDRKLFMFFYLTFTKREHQHSPFSFQVF